MGRSKNLNDVTSFSLTPYFLETLYKRHEHSLVYLGLQGDVNHLKDLQKSMGNLLSDYKLPAQTKFLPHITIGRLKRDDPVNTKFFLGKIDEVEIPPLSNFTVDHITLYESFVSSTGSHYQKIGQFALEYNQL
jgi:2'-5' RNA ligase